MPRRNHIKKRIIEGRCIDCGEWAEFGKLRCYDCLNKQSMAARERFRLEKKRQKLMQARPFKFM